MNTKIEKRVYSSLVCICIISILVAITGCSGTITQQPTSQTSSNLTSLATSPASTPVMTTEPTLVPTPVPTTVTTTPTTIPTPKPTPTPPIVLSSTLQIGDYIQMGNYYNEPILWRCVDIDENGPLMLSDRILTIKAFDGGKTHQYLDGTIQPDDANKRREVYGSNIWETSDIRSWLNSSQPAGKVIWLDGSAPAKATLRNQINEYASEKGFLSSGNFTAKETESIKLVTQKSIISSVEEAKLKTDGTEPHQGITYTNGINFPDITKAVQNYDTAYSQKVQDKIFLMDIKQANKVFENGALLGKDYYIGKPTRRLVENSEYHDPELFTPDKNWYSYTRTPQAKNGYSMLLIISMDGPYQKSGVFYDNANDFYIGIRPAFYMNLYPDIFHYGAGTRQDPKKIA